MPNGPLKVAKNLWSMLYKSPTSVTASSFPLLCFYRHSWAPFSLSRALLPKQYHNALPSFHWLPPSEFQWLNMNQFPFLPLLSTPSTALRSLSGCVLALVLYFSSTTAWLLRNSTLSLWLTVYARRCMQASLESLLIRNPLRDALSFPWGQWHTVGNRTDRETESLAHSSSLSLPASPPTSSDVSLL